MPQTRLLLSRDWLLKSWRDLSSARKLAAGNDPYLDTAIYHCQQAAEKAVKGFLFFRHVAFKKTHDIRMLAEQASNQDSSFAELLQDAEMLTSYVAAFRYPNEADIPSKDQFNSAVEAAERIYRHVLSKHPELDPERD